MKELTIITHLGLGDLILQSGLAVHLAKEYDRVYFHCRKRDYNSVRSFFLLQPKIEVVPLNTESPHPDHRIIKRGTDALLLGFYSKIPMDRSISFSENFYQQAGVDYSVRWDKCPIQEVVDKFYDSIWSHNPASEFDFVHDDPIRAFIIPKRDCEIRVLPGQSSILSYYSLMREASEIHVIDSCFLHLAESIDTEGCELVYHKYARPLSARWNDIDCPTRKKWTILT